ncbi:MAG: hypothetical protein M3131_03335 [Actinomycetota bacterium]|nr:hypothetical protein [Actinomycetota bacterium]
MRKAVAGIASAGAFVLAAGASPAMAAPNERACENAQPHGTERAHMTVPERNQQAHERIPHFCHH